MATPHTEQKREVRERRPAAASPFFTVRVIVGDEKPTTQVSVPVRVDARATGRNRIKRQVMEALRAVMREHHIGGHVAILVRRPDIPKGVHLRNAIFELLKESGMIKRS